MNDFASFAFSWYFGVIVTGVSNRRAFIREGRLRKFNIVEQAFIREQAFI